MLLGSTLDGLKDVNDLYEVKKTPLDYLNTIQDLHAGNGNNSSNSSVCKTLPTMITVGIHIVRVSPLLNCCDLLIGKAIIVKCLNMCFLRV